MKTASTPFPRGIPPTYAELVGVLLPRAIQDAVEFKNASEIMNAMAGHELNEDQEDYLKTISR
jgi:hypothetical protein